MSESKQIKKPAKDKFTKVEKNGQFKETKDGYFWEETTIIKKYDRTFKNWSVASEEIKLLSPEDSPLHLKKSALCHIIFTKETEDKSKWNGVETSYWYMQLKYDMRPDADNLFFVESDGKLFIRDLHFNVTSPIALNQSNENYKCTQIGEIEKISPQKATEIVHTTGTRLIFGKVESDSKGNITSFGVVV